MAISTRQPQEHVAEDHRTPGVPPGTPDDKPPEPDVIPVDDPEPGLPPDEAPPDIREPPKTPPGEPPEWVS